MLEFQSVFGSHEKRKYGFLGNILYNMKAVFEFDKKLFYYQILPVVPAIAASFLGALIPSEVVRILQGGWGVSDIAIYICILTLLLMLCNMAVKGMEIYVQWYSYSVSLFYSQKCCEKMMQLDYDLLEGEENQKLIGNTWQTVRNGRNFVTACVSVPQCLISLVGVLLYGYLVGKKNLLLVLCMVCSVLISMKLLSVARKKHREYHEKLSRSSKEAAYISRQAVEGSAGKDIRIYGMTDWFLKKYDEAMAQMDSIFLGIHNWYFLRSLSDALIGCFIDFFAWGYLIYLLVKGTLTTAEFVFYLGLASGFALYLETFIRCIMELVPMSVSISYIREFLQMENRWGQGDEVNLKEPVTVEFRNVSFTYPGQKKPTLSNLNLTIRAGEKIALLGLNGAGKTTFVKLLCGFYRPAEGEILVNGKPITSYGREAYYKSVAVLFQDSSLLPVSLDQNLTGQMPDSIDRERLHQALSLSGFLKKYTSLPQKGDTFLVREVNEQSVDFSGGEKQKLLFARALYKDSRLLILDEPTAALDPIAENELYQMFGKAAAGRTVLYISHRLSSTRFCDRIFLLEGGRVTEEGTHESLMKKGGRYAQLFEIQGRYYKE